MMANLTSALQQLRAEQREAQLHVEKLGHGVGKGAKPAEGAAKTTASAPVKRTMSASARRKIAAAQRARWAKFRVAKKKAA
jgi:hypothetical protein